MTAAPRRDLQGEIVALAASCQFNPQRWANAAWDWGKRPLEEIDGPRVWQDDILRIIGDHLADPEKRYQPLWIAIASGHGIGKSALIGIVSNWAMSCWSMAKVVATANTEKQLRTKTAPEIGKWFRTSLTAGWFDVQAESIKSLDKVAANDWRLDLVPWSQNNTEAFAGLHNLGRIILLVFDEASKIHDKVWEVAEGAMTDENTVIIWLAFGNPTQNTGRFRECFRRFRHRWVTRQIDSRTVPGTNKDQIQRWLEDHGEDSDFFKVRVRGQFPAQSAKQLISSDDVDAARSRHLRPDQYSFAPVILSLDPAWEGDDELVIGKRQGLRFDVLFTMAKNDDDVWVANKLAALETEHRADAVFVDGGYGTGIVSAGRAMGRTWQIIWFSGKPTDPGYVNKRAEMWGAGIKPWLKEGGTIDPKDEVLYQDLIGPETVPRLDGKVLLESKDDMKSRGIPSPGRGDALALTFARPVVKKDAWVGEDNYEPDTVEYHPFA